MAIDAELHCTKLTRPNAVNTDATPVLSTTKMLLLLSPHNA